MKYQKQVSVSGKWVKASELKSGIRAKLVAETIPTVSQFKDDDGAAKMQDVTKIRFENITEVMNVSLNRATINGLVDAFGEDSKSWINQYLTVQTEKMIVGGKRVTALYLVPEGFEVKEDDGGYLIITRKGVEAAAANEVEKFDEKSIEYPEADKEEIPF